MSTSMDITAEIYSAKSISKNKLPFADYEAMRKKFV